MSEEENFHCRLCAEPTPLEQLISCDDDVGQHSKITNKLLWINIDVSGIQTLPKTICFSCFDLLERTWLFLHNVRTAQGKLYEIYSVKVDLDTHGEIGKPVDENWERFCGPKPERKTETKEEKYNEETTEESLLKPIKREPTENDCDNYNGMSSSDSDRPLKRASKKKKVKPKRKPKKKYDEEILTEDLLPNGEAEVMQLDMSIYTMTWEDYTWCCANCDAQCKTIDLLRLHSQEIHHCCPSFKCSDCNKVAYSYKSFLSHVKSHYKSLRRHCDLCNKYFNWLALLRKHRRSAHREAYVNNCRACGASFDEPELLQDHMKIFAKSYRKQTKKLKQEKLDTDMKCDVCSREFKSRSNLAAHVQTHMERTRDFSCHVCGKMFYTKGALSTHMATHEDTKPFKCEFCPMAFRARGNLTSHASLHSGAKPFVCEQCGKSFRVKRHLKSHSIVHTDLMPYVCEYCNKSFRFKTRLNLHIRQHTGAKPYTCIYCRRDFTNGSNYKKHMHRRHNIDTSVRKKIYNSQPMQIVLNMQGCDNDVNDASSQS